VRINLFDYAMDMVSIVAVQKRFGRERWRRGWQRTCAKSTPMRGHTVVKVFVWLSCDEICAGVSADSAALNAAGAGT
jgi:hypothetical protein